MNINSKIYVAGHTGMVGSALTRNLRARGFSNLVFTPFPQFDLTDQAIVINFFKKEKPEYVFLAAARVGGIMANNTYRAQFIYENLMIQNNIIHQSYLHGVKKLLFLGSSCIYPKNCPQPIKEEFLLTGELEYTNEPYAIAKIAGLKMCEAYNMQYGTDFISVMPTNLFGPNDNYDLVTSHVLPALIRKMHLGKCLESNDWHALRKDLDKRPVRNITAKSGEDDIIEAFSKFGIDMIPGESGTKSVRVTLWGTGEPFREFLYVEDLADACVYLLEKITFKGQNSKKDTTASNHINIGTGMDLKIRDLAHLIKEVTGFKGKIEWDKSKPDGTFRKQLDITRLTDTGWHCKTGLKEGIEKAYSNYLNT